MTISFQSCPQAIRTRTTRLVMESLENRALLAAGGLSVTPDLIPASSALQGDANLDGDFNSMDLVQVFQAGKYETSQAADWSAGDWNLDARFDSQDLIAALQRGTYSLDARPSAEIAVPFKGSLQAVNTFDVQFPTLFVDASGSGNATHLGHFTVTYEEVVNILVPGSGVGSAHFIAANGDSIFTTTETLDPPQSPEPNVLFAMVEHTITSGTGRFAGATGSFTEERFVNLITSVTSSSFDGTIVLHEVK